MTVARVGGSLSLPSGNVMPRACKKVPHAVRTRFAVDVLFVVALGVKGRVRLTGASVSSIRNASKASFHAAACTKAVLVKTPSMSKSHARVGVEINRRADSVAGRVAHRRSSSHRPPGGRVRGPGAERGAAPGSSGRGSARTTGRPWATKTSPRRGELKVVALFQRVRGRLRSTSHVSRRPRNTTLKASRVIPSGSRGAKESDRFRPHAAETRYQGDPGARQRGHVKAISRVVLEVFEIHQSGLGQVVVGEREVPHFGRHHRWMHAEREESRTVKRS